MTLPAFEEFRATALERGAEEVLERRWAPGTVLAQHTHPFTADALVVEGEMWLEVGGREQHLVCGDRFHVDAGLAHSERYGVRGAVYWVARHACPTLAASQLPRGG